MLTILGGKNSNCSSSTSSYSNFSQNQCPQLTQNNNIPNGLQTYAVHQINLGGRQFVCHEVQSLNAGRNPSCKNKRMPRKCLDNQDPSWILDQNNNRQPCGKQEKESALSRRKKYALPHHQQNACIPITGPITEYQEAYSRFHPEVSQKPKMKNSHLQQNTVRRPPWDGSITVPSKTFEEGLDAAEVKLRLLDLCADPSPNMMALAMKRERATEAYRQARNMKGGGGGGETLAGDWVGRQTEIGEEDKYKRYIPMKRVQDFRLGPPKINMRKPKMENVKARQLELDEESLLSYDADEVLNNMWKKLENGKFECHLFQ